MASVFMLSLRQLGGRKRLALLIFLSVLPIALTAIITSAEENADHHDFTNVLLGGMLVAAILPIVIMALATAAFGNELEDRTLSHLVLKPIPRWSIVLPKFLAVALIGGPLIIASGVITTFIGLEGEVRPAIAAGVGLLVGVVTYSAIFTWAGLMTTRALGIALVYVFLWEGLLSQFLGGIRLLSVRGYTIATMYGIDEDGLEALGDQAIDFPTAIVGAILVTLIFFWLTVRRLRRMDVP